MTARADLGVAERDLHWRGRRLEAVVHSLGSRPSTGAVARLEAADGRILAEASVPDLAAPDDLRAKTTTVRLSPPSGADLTGARLRIVSSAPEITDANNDAAVPARSR